MPPTNKFQLLVESQSRGEAEIAKLNAIVNKLAADIEKSNKKIAESAAKAQIDTSKSLAKMSADTQAASKSITSGSESLLSYGKSALIAFGSIKALTAGFDTFVRGASEAALEIKSLSLSTGLTINQADKLRAAANLTGFDIRNLKEAAIDLSVALKDTGGQGDQTRSLLRQLGVSAFTSTGQTRKLNDVLLETFDALSKVQDTTTRVNLSRVLGGEDAAKNVQPLLAGYREANQLATELGFGTREGLLKALEDSNKQLRAFDLQWEIIKGKLAANIAPIVIPLVFNISSILNGKPGSADALKESAIGSFLGMGLGAGVLGGLAPLAGKDAGTTSFLFADPGIKPKPGAINSIDGLFADRLLPGVPGNLPDFSTAQILGSQFRAGLGGSKDSLDARLVDLGKDRARLTAALSSGVTGPAATAELKKQLARVGADEVAINRQLAFIAKAKAGEEITIDSQSLVDLNAGQTIRTKRVPSLFGNSRENLPEFISTQADRDEANPFVDDSLSARAAAQQQKDTRERDLNTQFAKQFVAFEERRIDLLTGPGGELAAINKIYELKRAGLEQELQYGNEIFDLTARRLQIEQDRTLAILNLQRQRKDEARGLASDFVGSLQAGDPASFFKQQGGKLINQIGTNALAGPFQSAIGTLGKFGASTGLGGLLKGTLLDSGNATPVDRNTLATERNTAAIIASTGGGFNVSGPNGLNALRALGPVSGFINGAPDSVFGGAGSNPLIFSETGSGGTDIFGNGGPIGVGSPVPAIGKLSGLSKGIGYAGAIAGGAFGAYNGFKAGGAQGILSGTGSIAGAAAAVLSLAGVTGPAAPIAAGIGLTLMAAAKLIGDPKKNEDRRINQLLEDSRYTGETPMSYAFDRYGGGYDTNKREDIRPITVYVQTMDAKSFSDNREMIADAVRQAAYEGHSINRALQETVLGM